MERPIYSPSEWSMVSRMREMNPSKFSPQKCLQGDQVSYVVKKREGGVTPPGQPALDSFAPNTPKWRLSVEDHRAQSLGELQNAAYTVAELPIGNFLVRSLAASRIRRPGRMYSPSHLHLPLNG